MKRLHLGCGARVIEGWINIDEKLDPSVSSDLLQHFAALDLRERLPYDTGSVDRIFSEHFLEHLHRHDAVKLLKECRRVMIPGGVIRVSVPDLRTLIDKYLERDLDFASAVGWAPATPCQLVNEGLRLWGHLFVYDAAELVLVFREAGFDGLVITTTHGITTIPGMPTEGRPFLGDIVVEAQR